MSGTGQIVGQFIPNAGLVNGVGTSSINLTLGWITFYNESIYGLALTLSDGISYYLPAGMGRNIQINQPSAKITWTILTTLVIAAGGTAPANIVTIEELDPSDTPSTSGLFILAGGVLSVGNLVLIADQTINDGNPAGTTVVEGKPSGASGSQLLWNNDGSGIFGGGRVTVGNTGAETYTVPLGALPILLWILDNTLNGGGHRIQASFAAANILELTDITAAIQLAALDTVNGLVLGVKLSADGGLVHSNGSGVWTMQQLSSDGGQVVTDGGGNLSAKAFKRFAGFEEVGYCGGRQTNQSAAGLIKFAAPFRTDTTNALSSVTLSATIGNVNTNTVSATGLQPYGFILNWLVTAAGASEWDGTYTWVGN